MIEYVKMNKKREDFRVRSLFTKYLIAFVAIISISFLALSGIITSIIRNYVTDDTEERLGMAGDMIVGHIESESNGNLKEYISTEQVSLFIFPIVDFDTQFDVIITDDAGEILLSTAKPDSENYNDYTTGDMGKIDLSDFAKKSNKAGEEYYSYNGTFDGLLEENSLVYAKRISTDDSTLGYVMTISSTVNEDKLIGITRRAVINSSIWVLLAAIIAAYFITERMIHPLRTMTGAVKKFAKGDFSTRVQEYGKDEVAELATAFNNMAESLDSLEKMRNSFLANISHELRTPMTTIAGFIDGINSGAIPPEKHEYYLGVISAEVHRLSRLVSQILDVSRLESGERKFNYTDFDVVEVSRLILISFEQKIDDKHLDVSFESEEDELIVNADNDAIYQVIYNLCHNAIKFSRDGAKFAIKIKRGANKKINVSVYNEGQGIPQEDSKLIFDRFYKTDKSRGLDKSGVGLGLYISKTIIDAHEESIWVESVGEDGTEFTFTLKEGTTLPKRKLALREDEL